MESVLTLSQFFLRTFLFLFLFADCLRRRTQSHTCAINSARTLLCWGQNFNGQVIPMYSFVPA